MLYDNKKLFLYYFLLFTAKMFLPIIESFIDIDSQLQTDIIIELLLC
jgi:hypothetical protein